jgi:exosortase D (VPLPA-CTERM-specific)
MLGFLAYDGLTELVKAWDEKEEYSYGYLIPFIAFFLVWQKKDLLERVAFPGAWWGILIVLLGIVLLLVGTLSTFYHIIQYSVLIIIVGLALSFTGWQGIRILWAPLLILFFMVPLPGFVLAKVSSYLQIISSELGVLMIRAFGISVYLEGNVIDLGTMKLQVVEACSGLRYLFPLMTLAFICAYFYNEKLWKRVVVFLSSIPITIFMNSFRIGAIGVLVEHWGPTMAEGFLHDFEGWVVFMACTAILVLEMWFLNRVGGHRRQLREAFGIDFPAPTPKDIPVQPRSLARPYVSAILLVVAATLITIAMPERSEAIPPRQDFSQFPLKLGEWEARRERLEQVYLDVLKLDDYLLADFVDPNQDVINLYVAYYASQSKGAASHSPSTCLPGGGWEISSLTEHPIEGALSNGRPLLVNRAVISKEDNQQLVYYWFKERDRNVTNEYKVRWYIFLDALTRNRSDGALIRVITPVAPGESLSAADHRLAAFTKVASESLGGYLPD